MLTNNSCTEGFQQLQIARKLPQRPPDRLQDKTMEDSCPSPSPRPRWSVGCSIRRNSVEPCAVRVLTTQIVHRYRYVSLTVEPDVASLQKARYARRRGIEAPIDGRISSALAIAPRVLKDRKRCIVDDSIL